MKCPQCQHDGRPRAKFCEDCGTPFKRPNQRGPVASSYTDLEVALTAAQAQVTEALKRQTATAEILQVISSSPTDAQPVFDAIARRAVQLCDALFSTIYRYDGILIHHAADNYSTSEMRAILTKGYPSPVDQDSATAAAIRERRIIHTEDVLDDTTPAASREVAVALGYRTALCVPMLRNGAPIGSIAVARRERRPFSDTQIDLIKTFADQAVIAIENVRLFKELEAKNDALTQAHAQVTEALEQQTATADILRTISTLPSDVRPVLEAVVQAAARFCDASNVMLARADGDILRLVAGVGAFVEEAVRRAGGMEQVVVPIDRGSVFGRSALERRTVHIADLAAEPEDEYPTGRALQNRFGHRTLMSTPLLREGVLVGVIGLFRDEVRPFSNKQISRLAAFADQAVIAIENVRLFTELDARNRELRVALEQQTATSEILRVISGSPTDIQPVFDTIVKSVARLCDGMFASVHRFDGELLHWMAQHNFTAEGLKAMRSRYPMRAARDTASGRAVIDRTVIHIHDFESDPDVPTKSREIARAFGYRSLLAVPMVRESQSVGAIAVARLAPFSAGQIALLETFADQAVIAIENVRLFNELQARTSDLTRSVDELTALGEVSRALSSTLDLETVLQTIVGRANELTGTAGCTIWDYDAPRAEFRLRASHYADEGDAAVLQAPGRITTIRKGQGVTTQVVERRQPVQIRDIAAEGVYESPIRRPLIEAGHRALLGVPLVIEDEVIGVLAVTRKVPGEFEPEIVRLLSTFATQSALAIQNGACFWRSRTKAASLRLPASTSRSSSPTCPTNCGRR